MALLIWRGPSQLDGQPLVLALTGHDTKSTNIKTGPVLQTWILRADIAPQDAVRSGTDTSICGTCPNRHHTGGGCYVLPWQAPTTIWKSVQGKTPYMYTTSGDWAIEHNATLLRLGSYGDPMAVPVAVWQRLRGLVGGLPIIGYTHQWGNPELFDKIGEDAFKWYRLRLQASTQDAEDDSIATFAGWNTFRILAGGQTPLPDSIECRASDGITCDQCCMCGAGRNIWIKPHGARKGAFK